MIDRPEPPQPYLRVALMTADPMLRAGLVTRLAAASQVKIVLELSFSSDDRQTLQAQLDLKPLDVLLLSATSAAWPLCQALRSSHPTLPILLLGIPDPPTLAAALQSGAAGFWNQSTDPAELLTALRQVAAGQSYWTPAAATLANLAASPTPWALLKQNLRRSGLRQITATLTDLERQLSRQNLPLLDQLILSGRRRELRTAQWLVNRLLAPPPLFPTSPLPTPQPEALPIVSPQSLVPTGSEPLVSASPSLRSLQSALFDSLATKLQSSLRNLTATPLEIDILKPEKKQELLYLILRKLEEVLDELRLSQVPLPQLAEQRSQILQDLWQASLSDFFGKYYCLDLGTQQVPLIEVLQQDRSIVQTAILNKIPLVETVLAHLLFQTPLAIDDATYEAGTIEAMLRTEILLQNLTIQIANAVLQPLLNRFGDVTEVKQLFYDKRLLSSREIERFRNQLSWKYRVEQWIGEPQAIFESRFNLLILQEFGIVKTSIYAPRNDELATLSGVQYAVTLALETRDAIAPRLSVAISFVGSGLVYVLTEVIGRGLGLIGRGVVKGIGNALQDGKSSHSPRSSDR
jgi:DNA-binding NarL/FixJ family response regulator